MGMLSGMAAGAAAGSIAGPPGLIVGALLGSAVGAIASIALDAQEAEDLQRDEELDRDIGVINGDIGEARSDQPPTVIGAFSAAAVGIGRGDEIPPSEGPIRNVESE